MMTQKLLRELLGCEELEEEAMTKTVRSCYSCWKHLMRCARDPDEALVMVAQVRYHVNF